MVQVFYGYYQNVLVIPNNFVEQQRIFICTVNSIPGLNTLHVSNACHICGVTQQVNYGKTSLFQPYPTKTNYFHSLIIVTLVVQNLLREKLLCLKPAVTTNVTISKQQYVCQCRATITRKSAIRKPTNTQMRNVFMSENLRHMTFLPKRSRETATH